MILLIRQDWKAEPTHTRITLQKANLREASGIFYTVSHLTSFACVLPPGSLLLIPSRSAHETEFPDFQNCSPGLWCFCNALCPSLFHCLCACMLTRFSRVWLFVLLWTVVHQAPLSIGFSRKEYWSRLPCLPPGDLPHPGIEPMSLVSCMGRWVLYH